MGAIQQLLAGYGGGGGSWSTEILADTPLIWLKCDENSGGTGSTVADSSGNARNCAVTFSSGTADLANISVAPVAGLAGIVRAFDMTNALTGGGTVNIRDTTPDAALRMTTGGMSFEWWWVAKTGFRWIVFNGLSTGAANCYYELRQNSVGTGFELKGTGASANFGAIHGISGSDTNPHHMVMTINSARTLMTMYKDGVSLGTNSVSGTFTQAGAGETFHLGERPDQAARSWLNEVLVYNTELSAARVAAHYAARNNP